MDGLQSSENPIPNGHQASGTGRRRAKVDQPQQPVGAHWLKEFLLREGIVEDRSGPSPDEPDQKSAEKSYRGRILVGAFVLLAVGLAGVFAYRRFDLGDHAHRASAAAVALLRPTPEPKAEAPPAMPNPPAMANPTAMPNPPALMPQAEPPPAAPIKPAPAPQAKAPPVAPSLPVPASALNHPLQEVPGPLGGAAMASSNLPPQPVDPPPTVMSNWAGALVIPALMADPPKFVPPAVPSALPAALPNRGALPAGTPLQLRIVYAPSDPAEAAKIDALTSRLRSQVTDIDAATISAGPVADEGVVYFFPTDRAAASRVAASLAGMTRRAEPVALAHATSLPRPGTVEIRLPVKIGKELQNEQP